MAELLRPVQAALDGGDGNGIDLPVPLPPDALQRPGDDESDRRLKHHLAVQSPLLQAHRSLVQKSVRIYSSSSILENTSLVFLRRA